MAPERRHKVIFLVTEDWYFWSHRLPMAIAARDAGFDVGVATRVTAHGDRIRGEGFSLHPLTWRRRQLGPMASLEAIVEIYRLYRSERPVLVHHVALKPVLLGGIAAMLAGVPAVVSMIAGTGYLGSSPHPAAWPIGGAMRALMPTLLLRTNCRTIVQNTDDLRTLAALAPRHASRIVVIAGSGVDLRAFVPQPEPPTPPVIAAYVGRMIAIKGVTNLVAAHQRLRQQGVDLDLYLVGEPDPENPSSIAPATLAAWQQLPGIHWLGRRDDVAAIWAGAHIAVLASSGGEGLPKTLLEAAAAGRPIVATNVAGTREIARHDINALLVAPDDFAALAGALAVLAGNAALRQRLGAAGRELVQASMSDEAVGAATVSLYRELLESLRLN